MVRDYKYAAPSPDVDVAHGAQLAAYRLAVRAAGVAVVDAELVFLRGGPTVRRLPPLDAAAEEAALVDAGARLGTALAAADVDAFPRAPGAPVECQALGCGYVRRCWRGATGRAAGPPTCTAGV